MNEDITSEDLTLFEPSKNDMLLDYPELKEYEIFTKISKRDMTFVWYISNRTSPLLKAEPDKKKRVRRALELAYDKKILSRNQRVMDIYNGGELPSDIVEAINVMASFNPSFRMRAKMLNEYNFEMLQSLSYLSEIDRAAMDIDDKKKYADLLKTTTSIIPTMIQNMETGFGVKVKKEKEETFTLKANISELVERVEKTSEQ